MPLQDLATPGFADSVAAQVERPWLPRWIRRFRKWRGRLMPWPRGALRMEAGSLGKASVARNVAKQRAPLMGGTPGLGAESRRRAILGRDFGTAPGDSGGFPPPEPQAEASESQRAATAPGAGFAGSALSQGSNAAAPRRRGRHALACHGFCRIFRLRFIALAFIYPLTFGRVTCIGTQPN